MTIEEMDVLARELAKYGVPMFDNNGRTRDMGIVFAELKAAIIEDEVFKGHLLRQGTEEA